MVEGAAFSGTREHKQRFHGWLPAHRDEDRVRSRAPREMHTPHGPRADTHADTDDVREHTHNAVDFEPKGSLEDLWPGTYYLKNVDSKYRRFYGQRDA